MRWKRVDFSINYVLRSKITKRRSHGTINYLVGLSCNRSAGSMGKGNARCAQRARPEGILRRKARRLDVRLAGSANPSHRRVGHGRPATGESGEISESG